MSIRSHDENICNARRDIRLKDFTNHGSAEPRSETRTADRIGEAQAVFGLTALGWITRPLYSGLAPAIDDTTIAIAGALALFLIPSGMPQGGRLMTGMTSRRCRGAFSWQAGWGVANQKAPSPTPPHKGEGSAPPSSQEFARSIETRLYSRLPLRMRTKRALNRLPRRAGQDQRVGPVAGPLGDRDGRTPDDLAAVVELDPERQRSRLQLA